MLPLSRAQLLTIPSGRGTAKLLLHADTPLCGLVHVHMRQPDQLSAILPVFCARTAAASRATRHNYRVVPSPFFWRVFVSLYFHEIDAQRNGDK